MAKESFVFYETFLETAEKLEEINKDFAYEYLIALAKYGLYGEVYEGNPYIELVMVQGKVNIDMAKERYQRAVENGKKGGRRREVDRKKVIQLHNEGKTNKAIAAEVGCCDRTVSRILNETDKTRQNLNENDNVNDNVNEDDDVNNNTNDNKNDDDKDYVF